MWPPLDGWCLTDPRQLAYRARLDIVDDVYTDSQQYQLNLRRHLSRVTRPAMRDLPHLIRIA
jgi:hypothetical protein